MNERSAYVGKQPDLPRARRLNRIAWILSAAILLLVGLMRDVPLLPLPDGWSTAFLPPLHAAINTAAAVVLIAALVAIRLGRVTWHKRFVFAAMALSVLFLLSYVAYHITTPPVRFGDADGNGIVDAAEQAQVGGMRAVYLIVLITHVGLAAVSLPFILFTFIAGLTHQFARHRRLARWVFPVWLYVAISGPVVYWMLRPFY